MSLSDMRGILEESTARRRTPGTDVWLLGQGPWWRFLHARDLDKTKQSLLNAAWRVPIHLFLVPEEPLDSELAPLVTKEAQAWRIDRARSAEDFYRTEPARRLGNWMLYAARSPAAVPLPNAFRTDPAMLLGFMKQHQIALLVDAFHDNSEWCIALRESS